MNLLSKHSTAWRFLLPLIGLQAVAIFFYVKVFLDHEFVDLSVFVVSEDTLFILLALVMNVGILSIVIRQLKSLIWRPLGGDPTTVIALMQDIVKGRLGKETITAAPETLLANLITMRKTIKAHNDKLKENADRLGLAASVFDHAQDGIFITDANLQIVDVNRSFTKITGYIKEAVIHHSPAELGFGFNDPDYFDKAEKRLGIDKPCRGEVWNLHADGNVYASWLDVFSVTNADGAVTNYVGIFSDITDVKVQQQNLEHMAYHDPLTQLPNRTLFSDRLRQALQTLGTNTEEYLAICYFDLDGFKPVNDAHGHEVGDKLLVELAKRLRDKAGENDTIARLGGDEFALLLNVRTKNECVEKLDKLLVDISEPYQIDGEYLNKISASIGYTIYPEDLSEPDTLLRHADHAMYHVKVNGRGFHYQFDPTADNVNEINQITVLKEAMKNGEFELYYQPKVNLYMGSVTGAEALIRWNHPKRGLVPPIEFIPLIEQDLSLTIALGEWVIEAAMAQIKLWKEQSLEIKISVNVSPMHMVQTDFSDRLEKILDQYPTVSPQKLELEITETAVIDDIEKVAENITACRTLGVSFALDDFGVGYSSLTYLRRLPVEVIKIDQSFVRDILQDTDDLAMVASVIGLGNSFGLDVVAEGVESVDHGLELIAMGCQYAQGYGISRPMPSKEFYEWVKEYKPDASWMPQKKVSNL